MTLPRVVYLSAPPHGQEMLDFLLTLPCKVVANCVFDGGVEWKYVSEYDLGLNFLGTHKIPAEEVRRPSLGWCNFHPAPLPQYRGRNLCYHAIMEGSQWFGATVHYMDESFDTGPIIEVRRFSIDDGATAREVHELALSHCAGLFRDWVPELLKARVPATPQPLDGRYHKREPINNEVPLQRVLTRSDWDWFSRAVRARTYHPNHHARLNVGGRWYKLVPEEA